MISVLKVPTNQLDTAGLQCPCSNTCDYTFSKGSRNKLSLAVKSADERKKTCGVSQSCCDELFLADSKVTGVTRKQGRRQSAT